ncbi:MAG: TonB family protein [Acidobacteriaceae bacterium]|nr:TonB family protein [Acidobacteriaceae bacterium]
MEQLVDSGPSLLLNWQAPDDRPRHIRAGVGTVLVHIVFLLVFTLIARYEPVKDFEEAEITPLKKYTPIIAPRFHLTQKEPNTAKVAKEIRLQDLLPKPQVDAHKPVAPIEPKKTFKAPPANAAAPSPKQAPLPPPPEPPKYEASNKTPQILPPSVIAAPPPPQPAAEKPKLTFETPGQGGTSPTPGAVAKVPIPRPSVDEAIRSVVRSGGSMGAGLTVSDMDQIPSPPDPLRRSASPGRMQSSVQLQSDPMGVDFKPYLIRVLATVKRNWFAVYPESARLGLRGSVALRFWVDREGQVPHLELAMPSGATALDRAAVASISASVPLPPLPAEYKGKQIVLQFSFQYN